MVLAIAIAVDLVVVAISVAFIFADRLFVAMSFQVRFYGGPYYLVKVDECFFNESVV